MIKMGMINNWVGSKASNLSFLFFLIIILFFLFSLFFLLKKKKNFQGVLLYT